MKKKGNKLYVVNKFNKPAFMQEENLFPDGGDIWTDLAIENRGYKGGTANEIAGWKSDYMNSKNAFGISKANNPFSKGNLKNTFSAQNIGNMVESGLGAVSGTVSNLLSGGHSSGAGTVLRTVGGIVKNIPVVGKFGAAAEILGGAFDGLFGGPKVNEAKLKAANEGTAQLNNTKYTANTTDELAAQTSAQTAVANVEDAYTNSLLGGGASAKNAQLKEARQNAVLFRDRSLTNAAGNIASNQLNDALANYSSFGGPLDMGAINYDFMTDYLLSKNKKTDNSNQMTNLFAGTPKTMFDFGGDLQTNRTYSVGKIYDVTEAEANRLKSLGYEFTIVR